MDDERGKRVALTKRLTHQGHLHNQKIQAEHESEMAKIREELERTRKLLQRTQAENAILKRKNIKTNTNREGEIKIAVVKPVQKP